jgi:hypothetical protein
MYRHTLRGSILVFVVMQSGNLPRLKRETARAIEAMAVSRRQGGIQS